MPLSEKQLINLDTTAHDLGALVLDGQNLFDAHYYKTMYNKIWLKVHLRIFFAHMY